MDEEPHHSRTPKPLEPQQPSLENAIFVLLGMVLMSLVLVRLYLLYSV